MQILFNFLIDLAQSLGSRCEDSLCRSHVNQLNSERKKNPLSKPQIQWQKGTKKTEVGY